MICEHCLQPIGERVTRGPLTVTTEPLEAFWHGRKLTHLRPAHRKILQVLAQRGRASHLALQIHCLGDDASPRAVSVHISTMRRRLPHGLAIESMPGFGYRLNLEGTMTEEQAEPAVSRTAKERLTAAVAKLPDDVSTAVLLYPDADGRIAAVGLSATLPQVAHMLGLATASIGKRMVPSA